MQESLCSSHPEMAKQVEWYELGGMLHLSFCSRLRNSFQFQDLNPSHVAIWWLKVLRARAPISKRNKQTEGKNEQNDDIFVCNHSAVHKRVTHFYSPKTDETKKKNWRKRTKNNAWHNKKIALFVDIFKMFSMLQRPWPKQRHKEHHRD